MRADLRNAWRTGPGRASGRMLPLATALTLLVIAAAGFVGAADFSGARWVPRNNNGYIVVGRRTTTQPKGYHLKDHSKKVKPKIRTVPLWVVIPLATALVLIALALLFRLWVRRRDVEPAKPSFRMTETTMTHLAPAEEPEPEAEIFVSGLELALAALDEVREPADAVVRAWLGLQETAEESGIVRYPSETPTEFASRVLRGAFADDEALRTLLRLYLRTRFGDHPVTAREVEEVRVALKLLLDSWHASRPRTTSRMA